MMKIIKNVFHVGAHLCVRPGRHAGLPLRLILCVFLITSLSACKVDFQIFGTGSVESASGSINCSSDGTTQTGDCTQTYNVDPMTQTNCTPGDPNCTVVTNTITETFTATPVQDDTFDGFSGHCTGAGPCIQHITQDNANQAQQVTAEVHFDPEAVPQDAAYTYNYLGQRASKTVNNITTYYIYDEQGNMLSELDASGHSIKDYIYMDGEYVAHVEQTGDTANNETREQLFYPINDHLGQSFIMVRADGKYTHEQYTNPFGQMHAQFVDASIGATQLRQNRRFDGQYYDAESGYAYNWNREYDSSTGGYMQNDPIGQRGGINTYAYVNGNPVMYVDTVGLFPNVGGGIGLGVGVVKKDGEPWAGLGVSFGIFSMDCCRDGELYRNTYGIFMLGGAGGEFVRASASSNVDVWNSDGGGVLNHGYPGCKKPNIPDIIGQSGVVTGSATGSDVSVGLVAGEGVGVLLPIKRLSKIWLIDSVPLKKCCNKDEKQGEN